MIKANIKNIIDVITNSSNFDTQELATAWVNETKLTGAFGKLERWLTEDQAIAEGKDIADAVDVAEMTNPFPHGNEPATYFIYKFPAEFTIEYIDITAELEAAGKKQESVEAINLGADIMADIRTLNKSKLADESMTEQQFIALLSDATAAAIERALWNGSMGTAKALIQSFSGYYTTEEKNVLISKIDIFLTKYP